MLGMGDVPFDFILSDGWRNQPRISYLGFLFRTFFQGMRTCVSCWMRPRNLTGHFSIRSLDNQMHRWLVLCWIHSWHLCFFEISLLKVSFRDFQNLPLTGRRGRQKETPCEKCVSLPMYMQSREIMWSHVKSMTMTIFFLGATTNPRQQEVQRDLFHLIVTEVYSSNV